MSAVKYSFDTDFRSGGPGRRAADLELEQAREQAFADGLAKGRAEAKLEANAALTHMAGLIAQQAGQLLAMQEERYVVIEQAAGALAALLAKRIAGAALAQTPLALIEDAARECISQARSAPHLSVRVNEALTQQTEEIFSRFAMESGYGGRILVLADAAIGVGDARIEWADGGVVINHEALTTAVDVAAAKALGAPITQILS